MMQNILKLKYIEIRNKLTVGHRCLLDCKYITIYIFFKHFRKNQRDGIKISQGSVTVL